MANQSDLNPKAAAKLALLKAIKTHAERSTDAADVSDFEGAKNAAQAAEALARAFHELEKRAATP